jgi:hypothetical protein
MATFKHAIAVQATEEQIGQFRLMIKNLGSNPGAEDRAPAARSFRALFRRWYLWRAPCRVVPRRRAETTRTAWQWQTHGGASLVFLSRRLGSVDIYLLPPDSTVSG